MFVDLIAIFEAVTKFVVALDQHPFGAVTLLAMVVAGVTIAILWK